MKKFQSLEELFVKNKEQLKERLSSLELPKDAEKVQKECSSFFNELLSLDQDFRQSLTSSEDEMLKCVIEIIKVQSFQTQYKSESVGTTDYSDINIADKNKQEYIFAGAGGILTAGSAALSGAGLLGTLLSFAVGSFLVGYLAHIINKGENAHNLNKSKEVRSINRTITLSNQDINILIDSISTMCKSIDTFILRYRRDIAEVINEYENRLKSMVFEKQYPLILESIQAMYGKMYSTSEKELPLYTACESVISSLESLGYTQVIYSVQPDNSQFFKKNESDHVTEPLMYLPAILRGDNLILKGLVFIPRLR